MSYSKQYIFLTSEEQEKNMIEADYPFICQKRKLLPRFGRGKKMFSNQIPPVPHTDSTA